MRLARERKPKYLLLENVKGLLSHNGGSTFGTIINTLWECGYNAEWQVLNSKNFGVPQNRERVFIIGYLRGQPRPEVFPIRKENTGNLEQFSRGGGIAYNLDANYHKGTSPGDVGKGRRTHIWYPLTERRTEEAKRIRREYQQKYGRDYSPRRAKKIIPRNDDTANTLTTTQSIEQQMVGIPIKEAIKKGYDIAKPGDGVVTEKLRIRKLTPLECFRLQGFPDEWYYKCKKEGISDTQMYRAAGDSVTVNVVEEIGRKLMN